MLWHPPNQTGELLIRSGSLIEGSLLFQAEGRIQPEDHLLLEEGSELWGSLYTSGNLDLRGAVYGSVITSSFLVKTPVSRYRNYLWRGKIDLEALSEEFVAPMIYPEAEARVLTWINDNERELHE